MKLDAILPISFSAQNIRWYTLIMGNSKKVFGIEFNRVTWYSKLLAAIFILGIFPALVFYIGTQYEKVEQLLPTETVSYKSVQDVQVEKYQKALEAYKSTDVSKMEWRTYKSQSGGFEIQYPKNWVVKSNAAGPFLTFKDPSIDRYEGPSNEMEIAMGTVADMKTYLDDFSTTTDTFMVGNEPGVVLAMPGIGANFGVLIKHAGTYYIFSFPPRWDISEVGNIEKYILWSVKFN